MVVSDTVRTKVQPFRGHLNPANTIRLFQVKTEHFRDTVGGQLLYQEAHGKDRQRS